MEKRMRRTRKETKVLILSVQIREQNLISLLANTARRRDIHLENAGESQTSNVRSVRRWDIIKKSVKATLNKRL